MEDCSHPAGNSEPHTNMLDFSGIVISGFDSPLISPFLDLVALV
jgi:hypothetical protein